ncbi:MAG TPA: hypothetical protein PKJ41_06035 [Bryobacteraceae bacterium]|nr:hypothetical protein [Bryobacteraceae bacterium]
MEDSVTHQLPQLTLDPTTDSTGPAEPADETSRRQVRSKMILSNFISIAALGLLSITGAFTTVRFSSSLNGDPADRRQNRNPLLENGNASSDLIRPRTELRHVDRSASASAVCNTRVGTLSDKPVFEVVPTSPVMANSTVPGAQFTQAAEPFTRVLEELTLRAGLKSKPHTLALGHTIMPGVEIRGDFASLGNDATREDRRMSPFRGLHDDWANVRSLFYCAQSLVIFPRNVERLVDGYRQEFGQAKTAGTWIDGNSGLTYIVHGDCLEISERRTP